PMRGLMMDTPLLVSSLLKHAATIHGDGEIVSRTVEGPIHRTTYADTHKRCKQLANALAGLGVRAGDRIGTIAWNGYRHYEVYFAVPGMGAVCHTMNPRLHPSQLAYVIGHAEDAYLFVDLTFVPLVEAIIDKLDTVKGVVVLTDKEHMPETGIANALCYEELVASHSDAFDWPQLDENTASSLCYTSGTTGNPKGVLYSHRSTVLHSYAIAMPDAMGLSQRDRVMPVVPMFHVNAWGIPYATTMTGAGLILPGPKLDGASLYELIDGERVTMTAGVPTLWMGLLKHLKEGGHRLDGLDLMIVGGSAAPPSMIETFEKEYGVEFRHAWGMTEMSPLGTVNTLKPHVEQLPDEDRLAVRAKQGLPVFGVEIEVADEHGKPVPRDGKSYGELKVRGPWICDGYYRLDRSEVHDEDGWFATGDVVTVDGEGYMQITDRAKDLIKSGGEWISSIDLENLAMKHPDVDMAAVIGVPHPRWDERPLLLVVPAAEAQPAKEDIINFLRPKIAKWWLPDDIVFVESLPIGATGKVLKSKLREEYRGHRLPED
ncbi:MAG: 3-(methylthio)propionyl-CoA ligase, partial [Alphaproteobacteria bacterium]